MSGKALRKFPNSVCCYYSDPIFHKLCTLLKARTARRMKLRLVSEPISRFERVSSWRNHHCCRASKLAKFSPWNRALSSCHKQLHGTPLGTSRWLKHWRDLGGPLQLGGDVSARLVQLQQVEASGELLGQMV